MDRSPSRVAPFFPTDRRASGRGRGRAAEAPLAVLGAALGAVLLASAASAAPYKIVGPDGRTTYTDRPPADAAGRVRAVEPPPSASGIGGDVALPPDLQQPASRYPVTLYTIGACDPCTAARQLLQARGIPYQERTVVSQADGEALQRLTGARDAPTLAIGTQILRGLAPEVWRSYLDAAGYPRESKLPATYVVPAPTPLVERREAAAPRPAEAPAARASGGGGGTSTGVAPAPAPGGIRF